MSKAPPTEYLTVFLVKEGLSSKSEIFKRPLNLEEPVTVPLGPNREGKLYIQSSQEFEPKWARLFRADVDLSGVNFKVASSGAVLLVKSGERLLALTFGSGRYLLKTESLEENFGFHAAMNSIDRDQIRAVDKKRFDGLARHTREQASNHVSLSEFGLDSRLDLVRSLTGLPRDGKLNLGKRMSGRDSFSVAVPTTLDGLASLLDEYLKLGLDLSYRIEYPEVGNLVEIDRKEKRDELNSELVEKLRSGNLDRTWLVIPETVEWSDAGSFRYSLSSSAQEHDDVHFKTYFDHIGGAAEISLNKLKRHQVFSFSIAGEPKKEWSVFKCIYAELESTDGTYFLDSGTWYKIDTRLVASVNNDLTRIQPSTFDFPNYGFKQREEDYIKDVANKNPGELFVMDQKMIRHGGGQSQIEFCDLYSPAQKRLIHVKRYYGSTVLSHLFAQGVVSAEAFAWDAEFRTKVNDFLDDGYKLSELNRPNPAEYEIAYAIAMRTQNEMVLPFFSRITLLLAYERLSKLNFKVTCSKIQIT